MISKAVNKNSKLSLLAYLIILVLLLLIFFYEFNQISNFFSDNFFLSNSENQRNIVLQNDPIPLDTSELPIKNEVDLAGEQLTATLKRNGINMGFISSKNLFNVGNQLPIEVDPDLDIQYTDRKLLNDIIQAPENPENKNLLVWPEYDITAPILYAGFPDMFQTTSGSLVNFRSEADLSGIESPIQLKLRDGIVHLPFTPLPGEIGHSYIVGHSSYYSFVESDYKDIFKPIERQSRPGEEFTIYDHEGRELRFRVFETLEVQATDVEESYKDFGPDRRVITLQCSVLENVNGRIMPNKRWLTRAELIL